MIRHQNYKLLKMLIWVSLIFLSFFMHFCPGTMTTHAESINSDLERGLDRRLRHSGTRTRATQMLTNKFVVICSTPLTTAPRRQQIGTDDKYHDYLWPPNTVLIASDSVLQNVDENIDCLKVNSNQKSEFLGVALYGICTNIYPPYYEKVIRTWYLMCLLMTVWIRRQKRISKICLT